ncbi:hypothetical protein C6A85_08665, partial [Mycobacterium sp. ITM-2017-0098]
AGYRAAFFDRDPAGYADLVSPAYASADDPSELFVTEHFARAGEMLGDEQFARVVGGRVGGGDEVGVAGRVPVEERRPVAG